VVERDIEESLDLGRVQIHRHHAVGPGRRDQIGHQLRGDRHARLVLPVLPLESVVRDHRRHPPRRRPPHGVDHDQELHQIRSRRERRLEHEDVGAADVLVDLDLGLAVREFFHRRVAEVDPEVRADRFGQRTVRVSREEPEPAVRPARLARIGERLRHG
jgi:hypothetical protein